MKIFFSGLLSAGIFSAATLAAEPTASEPAKTTLDLRLRHEHAEQTGLRDADALTLRTRLGFTTPSWHSWQAMIEAENVAAADGDRYNQSGLNPGGASRVVVADPEGTEINQVFARYTAGHTVATLGRQRLVLDQARFIGDVGWRQNAQTFDALAITGRPAAGTTLTGAFIGRVNRVLGNDHPQGDWDSESYVLHAAYANLPGGATLTGYAYVLDFANAAAQSCATYGVSVAGTAKLRAGASLAYRAEYAQQTDHGASPLDYRAGYGAGEAGLAFAPGSLAVGGEVLGANRGAAFRTPLATLHAFNGWADLFTTTPPGGLRDLYVKATAALPGRVKLAARYHRFASDSGDVRYGREWDVQLTRAFGAFLNGLVKFARFDGDTPAWPEVRKVWVQVEYVR